MQQPKPTLPTNPCNDDTQNYTSPVHLKVVKTYPSLSSSKHLGQHSTDEAEACLNELKDTLKQLSHMNISTKHTSALRQYLIDMSDVDSFIDSLSPEDRGRLNEAIDELTQIENALKSQAIDDMRMKFTLGRVMLENSKNLNTLSTFHRYESSIQRTLFKSLHELQRLQAARLGRPVSIPAALDINIS